jgi:hypothetical protein
MRSSLLLLTALLLAPLPTRAADAPFDLAALRAEWPGQDWLILERSLVFEMPSPDLLEVTEARRLVVLQESAREDLALMTQTHRPGCREITEVAVRTVTRSGAEHLLDREGMIAQHLGDHPTDPARGSVDLSGPRKGLAPGSLVEETVRMQYPAACYGGLIATGRFLGNTDVPTLKETAEVRCAGAGCSFAVDQPGWEGRFVQAEAGVSLERSRVRGLKSEAAVPVRRLPRLFVSTSADPLEAGRVLAAGLSGMEGPARGRVAGYTRDAKGEYPTVSDPIERLARFFGNDVPVFGKGGDFWLQGFDFGEVVKAADRPLLPLEWWAVTVAALRPHGGVPVILDTQGHLEPPSVGNVIGYDEIGVLIPDRGVVTHLRWIPMTEGTATDLAGRWMLRLDDDGPSLHRFPSSAAADRRSWTGTVTVIAGDFVHFDLEGDLRGGRGHELRDSYESGVGWWKKASKKWRPTEQERDRSFVGERVFKRQIAVGTVELPDEPAGIDLKAIYTQQGLWQKGEGVRVLALPLPESPPLLELVGTVDRRSDFSLAPRERVLELVVVTPEGHRLVGLPEAVTVDEGPIQGELSWEQVPEGARLRYRLAIEERILSAELAPVIMGAAELSRMASECYLVYEVVE